MRSSKLNLCLALLSILVICSLSAEDKPRKSDAAADAKKNNVDKEKNNRRNKGKYSDEDVEDVADRIALSSYADNRYTAFSAPEENYRTRSRWQAQSAPSFSPSRMTFLEDSVEEPEWPRFDFPDAFPPSSPFDSNPGFSSASSCSSLIDARYPIFSDVCGAVPQARYSLPNTFGHHERWQIAQVLNVLTSASADASCMRSLRLLICPMLFPSCQKRREPAPVLPCQSYCRAVKSRCNIPVLDSLPCEILPQSSDLCPTNQAYGSFAPPSAFPSVNSPPPSNFPKSRPYPSLQSAQPTQSLGSLNLFSSGPFASENLSPHLVDFPPRPLTNDYNRPNSRYSPLTRSSTETRFSAGARSSPASSLIKA